MFLPARNITPERIITMSNYSDFEYTSVSVSLSPSEARSGCLRTLRYPGAPAPLEVELPGGLEDGSELYVSAPFYVDYGNIEERELKILVRVEKPRRGYGAAAALLFAAAGALCVLLVVFARDMRRDSVPSADIPVAVQVSDNAALAVQTPEPTPTEEPLTLVQREARTLIPHFEQRYYLTQLDDRLLENFCTLYRTVSSFSANCSFSQPLTKDELSNLTLLLSYECPELLQFSGSEEITFYSDSSGNVVSAQLPLALAREEYEAQYRICQGVAETLATKAEGMSEYEKELLAYDYLTSNCFYSYDAPNASTAYGALGEREAKCDGISLAMKWLCEEMGISCMVMAGNTDSSPIGHAWNVVCIDGTYYDLDVTNDVNSDDRDYNYYGAFNVSRYWIRSKYPLNAAFSGFLIVPGSESMNMSYHALSGSYVQTGAEYEQALFDRLNALADGEAAYIQFESFDDYSAFVASVSDIMSRWNGLSKGSFNYSLSHLDEFQVCRLSIRYI